MEQFQMQESIEVYRFAKQLCANLFNLIDKEIDRKILLLNVPIHSINKMHDIENCLIHISSQKYEELQKHDQDQQPQNKSANEHRLINQVKTHFVQTRPNTSYTKPTQKKQNMLKSGYRKRKKQQEKASATPTDYSKFAAFIDLGFSPTTDPMQDAIRKKKEDEINKKLLREQADRKKILNKKKQDREMIETLMKDKKQLIFTYDYDGNLLPVSKIEGNKYLTSQCQMNYHIDSNSILSKNTDSLNNILKHNNRKFTQFNAFNVGEQKEIDQTNFSQFYKNFESMELTTGSTLKLKGKTLSSQNSVPNMEFLINKNKDCQRIQKKHYLEYIKNGNLKRFQEKKSGEIQESNIFQQENQLELDWYSIKKQMNPNTRYENITIKNTELLKQLKSKTIEKVIEYPKNIENKSPENVEINFDPIDQFNASNIYSKAYQSKSKLSRENSHNNSNLYIKFSQMKNSSNHKLFSKSRVRRMQF